MKQLPVLIIAFFINLAVAYRAFHYMDKHSEHIQKYIDERDWMAGKVDEIPYCGFGFLVDGERASGVAAGSFDSLLPPLVVDDGEAIGRNEGDLVPLDVVASVIGGVEGRAASLFLRLLVLLLPPGC
jgi:hypothetical protein